MTEEQKVVARIAGALLTGKGAIAIRHDTSLAVQLAWQIVNEVKDTTATYSRE